MSSRDIYTYVDVHTYVHTSNQSNVEIYFGFFSCSNYRVSKVLDRSIPDPNALESMSMWWGGGDLFEDLLDAAWHKRRRNENQQGESWRKRWGKFCLERERERERVFRSPSSATGLRTWLPLCAFHLLPICLYLKSSLGQDIDISDLFDSQTGWRRTIHHHVRKLWCPSSSRFSEECRVGTCARTLFATTRRDTGRMRYDISLLFAATNTQLHRLVFNIYTSPYRIGHRR